MNRARGSDIDFKIIFFRRNNKKTRKSNEIL